MAYYAHLNDDYIVTEVILADEEVIQTYQGIWFETFPDDPARRYAGIGDGFDLTAFIPKPFDNWVWNPFLMMWDTPLTLGIAGGKSPF